MQVLNESASPILTKLESNVDSSIGRMQDIGFIEFEPSEIGKINQDVESKAMAIQDSIKNILDYFEGLLQNIKGEQVNKLITDIVTKIDASGKKTNDSLERVTVFLKDQIRSYIAANENANISLYHALDFIDSYFVRK